MSIGRFRMNVLGGPRNLEIQILDADEGTGGVDEGRSWSGYTPEPVTKRFTSEMIVANLTTGLGIPQDQYTTW